MDEINFDEFRAIEQRNRAKKREKEMKNQTETSRNDEKIRDDISGAVNSLKSPNPVQKTVVEKIGLFLEMQEMQATVCVLILLDTVGALFISEKIFQFESQNSIAIEFWLRGLKSFSTFSLFFFLIEIVVNVLVFNTMIMGHIGYLTDIVVIALQLYVEVNSTTKAYKLLNFFRMWRVLRLFFSMMDVERTAHRLTSLKLEKACKEIEEINDKMRIVEDDIAREKVLYQLSVYRDFKNNYYLNLGGSIIGGAYASKLQGRS